LGRRPGTAPLRYRQQPVRAGAVRRRLDRSVAFAILCVETLMLATIWGPQPAGWLWIGSRIDYLTDKVVLAIVTAFIGMTLTMIGTIALTMRVDRVWKLVRRAAGYEQKEGVFERIFVLSVVVGAAAFLFWLFVIQGPGSEFSPNANTAGAISLGSR
jgi:hypothetical protein